LSEATNRRAIMGAILAAGSALALPTSASAQTPALSAVDRHILDLWRRHQELIRIMDDNPDGISNEEMDQVGAKECVLIGEIDEQIDASVFALAAVLWWRSTMIARKLSQA
jgi:hypothetical protein